MAELAEVAAFGFGRAVGFFFCDFGELRLERVARKPLELGVERVYLLLGGIVRLAVARLDEDVGGLYLFRLGSLRALRDVGYDACVFGLERFRIDLDLVLHLLVDELVDTGFVLELLHEAVFAERIVGGELFERLRFFAGRCVRRDVFHEIFALLLHLLVGNRDLLGVGFLEQYGLLDESFRNLAAHARFRVFDLLFGDF